jgi:hypothetical protein
VSKVFRYSLFGVIAFVLSFYFSSCEDEFNEFEFANDIVVSGNLMFDGDSTKANQRVFLILEYVRSPAMSSEYLDQIILDEDTTDENGFFSFTYKQNNKIVGSDTCGNNYAEGLRMSSGNNTVFSCFPSNRNLTDLEIYTIQDLTLNLTINLGIVDSDTIFFNYPPLDTLHPNYIERFDSNGGRHQLFYALSSPNKTIIASYSAQLKNGRYEGFSSQRRGFESIKYAIGFDAYLNAKVKSWRPEGKPFTDQLEISIN